MKYYKEIKSWDWDGLKEFAEEWTENGRKIKSAYLGSVMNLFPSGKYYTSWACDNVTKKEMEEDDKFYRALERVGEEYDACITEGEEDPTDIYAVWEEDI